MIVAKVIEVFAHYRAFLLSRNRAEIVVQQVPALGSTKNLYNPGKVEFPRWLVNN